MNASTSSAFADASTKTALQSLNKDSTSSTSSGMSGLAPMEYKQDITKSTATVGNMQTTWGPKDFKTAISSQYSSSRSSVIVGGRSFIDTSLRFSNDLLLTLKPRDSVLARLLFTDYIAQLDYKGCEKMDLLAANNSNQSLMSSIGSFFKRKGSSVNNRRASTESLGFKVRSKSLENLNDVSINDLPPTITELRLEEYWEEIAVLKSLGPHVVCILPTVALDFVTSCLYSIGANPLIPEDVDDVESLLSDCKAVLVDASAKAELVEAFITHHIPSIVPVVLLVSNCGTCDRRKALARKVIEKSEPTVISGRLGDIHALSQDIVERADGILESDENVDSVMSMSPPPLTCRRSPLPGRKSPLPGGRRSPGSPHFQRKEVAKIKLNRAKTPIPHFILKGQFRHQGMKDVDVPMAVDGARLLAAQVGIKVHLFEINTVTCGEFFFEVTNPSIGMEKLHSTVQCAGGIIASVLACVEEQGHETSLLHITHGLSMYHVAAEQASMKATDERTDFPPPGTLRVCLIDRLQQLDELKVRLAALIVKHNETPVN